MLSTCTVTTWYSEQNSIYLIFMLFVGKKAKKNQKQKQTKHCKIVVYRTICKLLSKLDETH